MRNNNENTNAFLIHLSSFLGYIFPLGSIITPLILWHTQKEKSRFLDDHGKEAVNFNISFALYLFILGTSFISFFLGGFLNNRHFDFNFHNSFDFFSIFGVASIVGLISLIKIALIIIAAMKANNGENYQYPFTITFIK